MFLRSECDHDAQRRRHFHQSVWQERVSLQRTTELLSLAQRRVPLAAIEYGMELEELHVALDPLLPNSHRVHFRKQTTKCMAASESTLGRAAREARASTAAESMSGGKPGTSLTQREQR
jgi:hypothetical protein